MDLSTLTPKCNNRLINDFFDYNLEVLGISKSFQMPQFQSFKISKKKTTIQRFPSFNISNFQRFKISKRNNTGISNMLLHTIPHSDLQTYNSLKDLGCSCIFKILLQYIRGTRSNIWSKFRKFLKISNIRLENIPKHSLANSNNLKTTKAQELSLKIQKS